MCGRLKQSRSQKSATGYDSIKPATIVAIDVKLMIILIGSYKKKI